jgi:hypothetical protein
VQDRLVEITPAASQWVFTFEIPERFTRSTMKGLSEGQATSTARTEIVNALHTRMLQYKEFPTSFEYKTACRRLVEKYPYLVDKSESGYVSYLTRILLIKFSTSNYITPFLKMLNIWPNCNYFVLNI